MTLCMNCISHKRTGHTEKTDPGGARIPSERDEGYRYCTPGVMQYNFYRCSSLNKVRVVFCETRRHKLPEQANCGGCGGTPCEILKNIVPAVRQHQ